MRSTGDLLVEEYLRRLDNASVFLTDERRAELRQEIVEHIHAGVEEAEAVHADAVRTVLERLGPPADIVASETGSGSTESTPVVGQGSPVAHGSAHGSAHEGDGAPPTEGGPAPFPPARPRRFPLFAIWAVAAAVVVAVLVVGVVLFSSGGAAQPRQEPSIAPSRSGTPHSTSPQTPGEGSPGASLTPSQKPPGNSPETSLTPSHISATPTGTPTASSS